jgi:hypothetical protein
VNLAVKTDKKLGAVMKTVEQFGEYCVARRLLGKTLRLQLEREAKVVLGLCLSEMAKLRYQHSDAIALVVLLFVSERVKMPIKVFLNAVDKVVKKKCNKLSIIRKAKCFALVKKVLIVKKWM